MKQPHIIFITTDQQRHDACAPAAPPFLRQPHTERLCHEGITFRHAYAESPVCVPARRSMLTGLSTFTACGGNVARGCEVRHPRQTLPACLGQLGYHTVQIGKFHVGPRGMRYGFDEIVTADSYYRAMGRMGHLPQPMRHGLGQCEFYPTMATVPEAHTLTSWTAEQAVEFIRHRRDPSQPFFMWLSFHKPHPPLDPPEPYYSMYQGIDLGTPAYGTWRDNACPPSLERVMIKQCNDRIPPQMNQAIRAAYYGLITQIDYNLGRVFEVLMDCRLWDDTLILYTSDHGEFLGDHGFYGKAKALEGSAHVPFILRPPPAWANEGPARANEGPAGAQEGLAWVDTSLGTHRNTPVTHCDILPTLVRAAGGEPPEWSDGMDIIATLNGELNPPRRYVESYWAENAYWFPDYDHADYISLTDGRWKYIWYPEGPCEQLFDLQNDPGEIHNLVGETAWEARRAELQETLIASQIRRGTTAVRDGQLVSCPARPLDARRLHARFWGGYHGEDSIGDVLH